MQLVYICLISALAINETNVALVTDLNYLRLFTLSSVQCSMRCIPGPVLGMAGAGTLLLVVYHAGGVFHGI